MTRIILSPLPRMVTKCLSRFNWTIKKKAAANRTAYNSEYIHITYKFQVTHCSCYLTILKQLNLERFTANQFILASSPFKLMARDLFFLTESLW
jgi:hypothetical protein